MKLRFVKGLPLAGAALVGCALGVWHSGGGSAVELLPQAVATERGGQQELDRLLKARYETAKALLNLEEQRLREGVTTLGRVCDAARWTRDSALELPVSAQERMEALTNYVAVTRRLEKSADDAAAKGALAPADQQQARYLRLDAEIVLLRTELGDRKR